MKPSTSTCGSPLTGSKGDSQADNIISISEKGRILQAIATPQ
jgi:hypothetical protein